MAITEQRGGSSSTTTAGPTPVRPAALGPSGRWSVLWAIGMFAIFVGERMIGGGKSPSRFAATIGGFLLVLVAIAARARRASLSVAASDRRSVERTLVGLYALSLFAVVVYAFQSDLLTFVTGKPLEHNWPRLATALAALWPAIWVAAAWPILFVELAYAQIARAPRLELGRIRDAMLSGFGLAFALVFAFSVAYVTSERDKKVDLAYFRTTRPGEVTRRIVRTLDKPIEVAIFFPAGNEVREELDNYFADLSKESAQLKVTHYDYDIDPLKAKEYGVSNNGIVVFVRGGRHEQLGIQREMESARGALRTLDKEVQQRLMLVVRPARTVAFTAGHGERTWEKPPTDTDKRPGLKALRDILADQNYDMRTLTAADGLGVDVPKEVTVVAVIGPQQPFQADELSSLNRFIDRGGRLLVALDPENHVDMHEVLEPLSLVYKDETLANDQVFARRTHQDSDRTNLVTATYSSHPSVTTLQRLGARAPIIMPGAGWINTRRDRPAAIAVDAPIKAHHATFVDRNHNFQQDPGEDRRAWELAATAIKKDGRVFVIADSDCLADEAIRAGANELLALDVFHWLMGDETYAGVPSTEADVPITHTRKQDVIWFYSTIFLAPALVVAAGIGVTRGGRKRRRLGAGSPTGPGAPGAGGAGSATEGGGLAASGSSDQNKGGAS